MEMTCFVIKLAWKHVMKKMLFYNYITNLVIRKCRAGTMVQTKALLQFPWIVLVFFGFDKTWDMSQGHCFVLMLVVALS